MKKVFALVLTVIMLVACVSMVSATDKNDVLKAIKEAMPGEYFSVQYVAIENMLNQVEVSSEQADQLLALVADVKANVQDKGPSLSSYSKADIQLVIADLQKAADILGLTMTLETKTDNPLYVGDTIAVFTNAEGKRIGTLDGYVIKKTDVVATNYAPFVVVAMLALAGVSAVVTKKHFAK